MTSVDAESKKKEGEKEGSKIDGSAVRKNLECLPIFRSPVLPFVPLSFAPSLLLKDNCHIVQMFD